MGTIKDLVDLVTQLSSSVQDRKFAAELRQIQSMIGSIQSEHATIYEQNFKLKTENSELKQQLSALQIHVSAPQEQAVKDTEDLGEEPTKVILFVSTNKGATSDRIAWGTQLNLVRAEHWLDELEEKELVYRHLFMGSPSTYSLSSLGRKYLVAHGLA